MIEREIRSRTKDGCPSDHAALPVVVLVVGLIVTAASVIFVARLDASERLEETEHQGVDLTHAIEHRVDDYSEILVGLNSFLTVIPDVGRDEFSEFLSSSEILTRFAGSTGYRIHQKGNTR